MTTHDYPTTADINDTIAVLKQEYKANGEWQTYTSDEKGEILALIAEVASNHQDHIKRIAAHELLAELTNKNISTGI